MKEHVVKEKENTHVPRNCHCYIRLIIFIIFFLLIDSGSNGERVQYSCLF